MEAKDRPKRIDMTKVSPKVLLFSTILFIVIFLLIVLGGGKDGYTEKGINETKKMQWGQVPGQTQTSSVPSLPENLVDAVAEIYFFDVGQSDSVLCRLPEGTDILIDAGSWSETERVKNDLKALGVKNLKCLIISNPLSEETGAAADLIKAGIVEAVCLPETPEETQARSEEIMAAAAANGIPVDYPEQNEVLYENRDCDLTLSVLSPKQSWKDSQNYSLVMKLEVGETSFLFMGTSGEPMEQALSDTRQNVAADVLKVGNHGASTGTTVDFLEQVNPSCCVISAAEDPLKKTPSEEIVNRITGRNIQLYRTDRDGSVRIQTNGSQLAVSMMGEKGGKTR